MKKGLLGFGLAAAWVGALAYGMHTAMRYEATPGPAAQRAPAVEPDPNKDWTVVIVAHPLCPCTKQSLAALCDVAAAHSEKMSARIVFVGEQPEKRSANMAVAASIKGAVIEWITTDEATDRYDTRTSGQVFVFRRTGELEFKGGITPGRGVDQPRYALELFASIFNGLPIVSDTDVYGCPLGSAEE